MLDSTFTVAVLLLSAMVWIGKIQHARLESKREDCTNLDRESIENGLTEALHSTNDGVLSTAAVGKGAGVGVAVMRARAAGQNQRRGGGMKKDPYDEIIQTVQPQVRAVNPLHSAVRSCCRFACWNRRFVFLSNPRQIIRSQRSRLL